MRVLWRVILQDVRYQIKYGFYFLYAFISILYLVILLLLPPETKQFAVGIIILSDPAMLGFFFIGGIWLLEKGEGLHSFISVVPVKALEYVLGKVISLGFISLISSLFIAVISGVRDLNYLLVIITVIVGSGIFTLSGLVIATYARSVNHYFLITMPFVFVLTAPCILAIVGIKNLALEIAPATILYRTLFYSVGIKNSYNAGLGLIGLILWFCLFFIVAQKRISVAIRKDN